jgi:hypothetical protein
VPGNQQDIVVDKSLEYDTLLTMKATIEPKEIEVTHNVREDVLREYLTIYCPNGWDDVKKLTKKVLTFEGRKFTFTGWNSDRNVCYFVRPLNCGHNNIATIN